MPSLFLATQEIGNDAVIAPVRMNILYRGIDNPNKIVMPTLRCQAYSGIFFKPIQVNYADITRRKNPDYHI